MARNSVGRVLPRHGRSQRFKSARANHKNQALTGKPVGAFLVFVPKLVPDSALFYNVKLAFYGFFTFALDDFYSFVMRGASI